LPRKSKSAAKESQNRRCSWSSSDGATLVRTLREQKDNNGNQSGTQWKPEAVADAEGTSTGAEWVNISPSFSFSMHFLEVFCLNESAIGRIYIVAYHCAAIAWNSIAVERKNGIHSSRISVLSHLAPQTS